MYGYSPPADPSPQVIRIQAHGPGNVGGYLDAAGAGVALTSTGASLPARAKVLRLTLFAYLSPVGAGPAAVTPFDNAAPYPSAQWTIQPQFQAYGAGSPSPLGSPVFVDRVSLAGTPITVPIDLGATIGSGFASGGQFSLLLTTPSTSTIPAQQVGTVVMSTITYPFTTANGLNTDSEGTLNQVTLLPIGVYASQAALFAAIVATGNGLTPSLDGSGHLVLTAGDTVTSWGIAAGDAAAAFGLATGALISPGSEGQPNCNQIVPVPGGQPPYASTTVVYAVDPG
jgi:hypothetical protein